MTAWIVVTSVSKSLTSCEIDTFITAWSRTMRNWAAARTARIFQPLEVTPQPSLASQRYLRVAAMVVASTSESATSTPSATIQLIPVDWRTWSA